MTDQFSFSASSIFPSAPGISPTRLSVHTLGSARSGTDPWLFGQVIPCGAVLGNLEERSFLHFLLLSLGRNGRTVVGIIDVVPLVDESRVVVGWFNEE